MMMVAMLHRKGRSRSGERRRLNEEGRGGVGDVLTAEGGVLLHAQLTRVCWCIGNAVLCDHFSKRNACGLFWVREGMDSH
jgi:hypothetical protein